MACHAEWKWAVGAQPNLKRNPRRFVGYEDNHYESEADSAEALLLMFLRTGKRGFFDEAEAWARYHTDLQAWRTEGWQWKDGGIWWPQGGPPGNRPVRAKANLDFAGWNKGTDADSGVTNWVKGPGIPDGTRVSSLTALREHTAGRAKPCCLKSIRREGEFRCLQRS